MESTLLPNGKVKCQIGPSLTFCAFALAELSTGWFVTYLTLHFSIWKQSAFQPLSWCHFFDSPEWHGHCACRGCAGEILRNWGALPPIGRCLWIVPERTLLSRPYSGEDPMKRARTNTAALVILRQCRSAYEYPGQLVLADIARLKKAICRAYYAAMRGV